MWSGPTATGPQLRECSLSGSWRSHWRWGCPASSSGLFGSNAGNPQPHSLPDVTHVTSVTHLTLSTTMQMHLPDYLLTDLVSTVAFGVVAILLIILGYVAFDKLTPKLDFDDLR